MPQAKLPKNKRVLLRVDLNLPIKNGEFADLSRLIAIGPTLNTLLKNQCQVTLCSHLGRPDPKDFQSKYSLQNVTKAIEHMYKIQCDICEIATSEIQAKLPHLNAKRVLLLENTRKYPGEKQDQPEFAKELAANFDHFVFDAFAVAHRKHATTHAIFDYIKASAGLLIEREIAHLQPLLYGNYKKPLSVILGGKKIETKIGVIINFLTKSQNILIGGAMANTFLKAKGFNIGKSLYEANKIETAKSILSITAEHECDLVLPTDVTTTKDIKNPKIIEVKNIEDLTDDDCIIDIGPSTVNDFQNKLQASQTVIANGPLGYYELPASLQGSKHIFSFLANSKAKTIIGGGDTIDCIRLSKLSLKKFNFISTGGGAMLAYLSKQNLAALLKLKL